MKMADAFKALGDPVRLEIVRMLAGKELCVCDILDAFKLSQPTVSHHLKVLKHAGLVEDRKSGKWVYYRLRGGSIGRIIDTLAELNVAKIVARNTCCEEESTDGQ